MDDDQDPDDEEDELVPPMTFDEVMATSRERLLARPKALRSRIDSAETSESAASRARIRERNARERAEHFNLLAQNFGDSPPTEEDFRLLDTIDGFDKLIKTAFRYISDRGHGPSMIEWTLRRHLDELEDGLYFMIPLVDLVASDYDERTHKERRRDLKEVLVAAGAMSQGRPIHKFLHDAGKRRARLPMGHPDELSTLLSVAEGAAEDGHHEYSDELYESAIDVERRFTRDEQAMERLKKLGLRGDSDDEEVLRDDIGEVVRSRDWFARRARRLREVRRHFGRSEKKTDG